MLSRERISSNGGATVAKKLSNSNDQDVSPSSSNTSASPLMAGISMSSFSTSISRPQSGTSTRSHTKDRPWEQKETVRCMFCRGVKCKRCGRDAYVLCKDSPIKRIHANWITDDILAMQRPADEHFVHHKFVEQLKELNIAAVFNLQEPGEHPFCGFGIIASTGFSYYPEKLMAAGIKHFNYSWRDMTTPSMAMMLDIVRIALNEIQNGGKVAVHCHAGFGRTGIVIASIMMAQHRYDAEYTINTIRERRPGSVQTTQQQVFVYEFQTAYTAMQEFYPSSPLLNPIFDKNNNSGLKTIAASFNDQHYCLTPEEAVEYAKCPKPVRLAIDLLTSAAKVSAALVSCFIIGLHPNLISKDVNYTPSSPLYMPPLEDEILIPKRAAVITTSIKLIAAGSASSLPINDSGASPVDPTINKSEGLVTSSLETGISKIKSKDQGKKGDKSVSMLPPKSGSRYPLIVKHIYQMTMAYRAAHAVIEPAAKDWISEQTLDFFKLSANRGDWGMWVPPETTLLHDHQTPRGSTPRRMSVLQVSESIERVHRTPRKQSPRMDAQPLSMALRNELNVESATSSGKVPSLSLKENVKTHPVEDADLHLPSIKKSSGAQKPGTPTEMIPFSSLQSSLPLIINGSSGAVTGTSAVEQLLNPVSKSVETLPHGRSKSFSALHSCQDDTSLHIPFQNKVADDIVSQALLIAEIEAKEKLQVLKSSAKSSTNVLAELNVESGGVDGGDGMRKKSFTLGHERSRQNSITNSVAQSKINSASGYLEIIEALNGSNEEKDLRYESHFFLGGILLVDWLESRADPLLDDTMIELLSDAWCKSISDKKAQNGESKEGREGNSIVPLATQGRSSSLLHGLVDSFSPERPKNRKGKSSKTLGRGSTYASFGVEGEPVTGAVLDAILKKNLPRHKLHTLQYIVAAMTLLYRSSVNTAADKELTRSAILRIAIACALLVRRYPLLVTERTMNPLLMSSIRAAKIQSTITRNGDSESTELDPNGFPLSIIHDIKVVVETFRLLIRAEWEYSTEVSLRVHWSDKKIASVNEESALPGTREKSPVNSSAISSIPNTNGLPEA